jgi:hypothetical protein
VAAAALVAASASASAVGAHGGFPGLIAEPDPVNPGGTVEILGDNLGSDETVQIVLIANGQPIVLGSTTTDGQGHLTVFVTVPADLPAARYTIQAQSEGGYAGGGTVELAGAPQVDQGGGDPYERGPISVVPSANAPAQPVAGGGGAGAPTSVPGSQTTVASDAVILIAALAIPMAMVLGLIGWRRRALARR